MSVGIVLILALLAVLVTAEAERWHTRRRQRAWDQHVEAAVALTDLPVFDATIRAMPLTEAALAVQGLLLDTGAVGDECEAWLRSGGEG